MVMPHLALLHEIGQDQKHILMEHTIGLLLLHQLEQKVIIWNVSMLVDLLD